MNVLIEINRLTDSSMSHNGIDMSMWDLYESNLVSS